SDESEVRLAAVGCLLRYGGRAQRERALETVRELARSDDPAQRRTAAGLLGQLEQLPPELVPLLEELVRDPEVAVCHQAMEAAGRSRAPSLVPVLLERLDRPEYRQPARAALEAFGAPVHERLLEHLEDPGTSAPVRTTIPAFFVPDAEQETVEGLVALLPELEAPARYAVLKALNKLRRDRKDLRFGDLELEPSIRSELRLAYTWTALWADLEDGAAPPPAGSGRESFLGRTLRQRRSEAVERAFRALALQNSQKDVHAA
ncbi:MAG: hypothetical protein GWM92_12445, partial [Gemmatimonadetes bacterium]|nr:HEAT repeat domain-containing protein [Gemmatimonadota bacterium]NIR78581.1 HEAT repeat domain-containing protein [Gemmatimonadota bacterium]NIT88187.1 HEAT repeat domain-containing protein [Gemmatimonadota bacterium]NIU31036.1 HEAT repeat domain-containing protein [Gemmatimonadota bacterium]NIU35783.1 hypothetical protein [Gemmatimonadota bacterium]